MASNYQLRKALYKQIKSKDLTVKIAVNNFFRLVELDDDTFLLNIDIQTDKGNINIKGLTKNNVNSYNTTSDIELSVNADNIVYIKNTSTTETKITSTSIELVKGILNESYFDSVTTNDGAVRIFDSEEDKGAFADVVEGSSSRNNSKVSSFSDNLYVDGDSVLNKTLMVNGLTTLYSLAITNNTTIGGTLGVNGATTLSNTLDVAGDLSVGTNKFNVTADSGNTSVTGTLGVSDATNLESTLGVKGVTTITNTTESTTKDNGALVVEGGVGIEGNINIGEVANVGTNLNVGGTTNITGNTTITGTTDLENTLGVKGVTTITNITESTTKDNGALVVEGGVGIEKSVNIGDKLNIANKTTTGSLDVTTDANITRNVNIDNDLTVDGIATITDLVVTNDLEVDGNVDVKGTLSVDEKTTLNDALDVVGLVDLKNETDSSSSTTGALKVAGGVGIANKLYVGNNTNISGALQAGGATTLLSTLGVTGETTLSSTLEVGGATTLGNILNVAGDLSVGINKFNVIADSGNTSVGGSLGVTGATTLGDTLGVVGDLSVTDKFNVTADSGNTDIAGTLNVVKAVTLGDTLNVTGLITGELDGNAATATALKTSRTIFGQSFNGTNDVTGDITFGTGTNKATLTYAADTARTFTVPNTGADADFVMTQGAQIIDGVKKFNSTISGSIDGNATTAYILKYARSINGTAFNGSESITTNKWGTPRNITLGDTRIEVDGSSDLVWSRSDLGIQDSTITIAAGSGLTGWSYFTLNQAGNKTITLNHSNSVAAGNVGPTNDPTPGFGDTFNTPYISYDAQGHITGTVNRTTTIPVTLASDSVTGLVGTGPQTFGGVKTFSSSPVVPAPAGDTSAVNKQYVDGRISGVYRPAGNWNAATNTPTLTNNAPANTGKVYRVTTAGTQFGLTFAVGDKLAFIENGVPTKWDNVDDVTSVAGKTGNVTLNKGDVGLGNVNNTADSDKPISTATQTAINGKEPTIIAGTPTQYWRGDKTWQTLNKTAVGLANVDNTADLNKPISTSTQTALDSKQPLDADLTSIAALSGTSGLLRKTATNTWGLDNTSYEVTSNKVNIIRPSGTATNDKYPSELAVSTRLDNINELIDGISGGDGGLGSINSRVTALEDDKESLSNKRTDIRITEADNTSYVSELGIKNYVDGRISGVYRPSGDWNAAMNTPTLANNAPANAGKVYRVSVAGTQFGLTFAVGDKLAFIEGGVATKWDNVDDVTSVAGKTGNVTLNKGDVGLGNVANVLQLTASDKGETANKTLTFGGTFKVLETLSNGTINERTMTMPANPNVNNYLTGVSGSANGTVTFTRQGLGDLTWTTSHTHDDRYYTETEIDSMVVKLAGAQTIAGNKTFSNNVSVKGDLTVEGDINVNNVNVIETSNGIIFEGETANAYKTTLKAVDPTVNREIWLPNDGGSVAEGGTVALVKNLTHSRSGYGLVATSGASRTELGIDTDRSDSVTSTVGTSANQVINSTTGIANRNYQVRLTTTGKPYVTIPWENTTYTSASDIVSGLVNIGTQTFGGDKTFKGNLEVSGDSGIKIKESSLVWDSESESLKFVFT